MSKLRNTIYYDFFTADELEKAKNDNRKPIPVKEGTKLLSDLVIKTGIDTIPTLSMTIPLEELPAVALQKLGTGEYYEPRLQNYVVIVHVQVEGREKYLFRGIVDNMVIDFANYNVSISLSHEVARMREWAMPVNYTVKEVHLKSLVGGDFAALGYTTPFGADSNKPSTKKVDFVFYASPQEEAPDRIINPAVSMTFGSNNKLEALAELIKNTEAYHFWVPLSNNLQVVLAPYYTPLSEQKYTPDEVIFSPYPHMIDDCSDEPTGLNNGAIVQHITMLTEPTYNVDYTDHYNRAVVFCGDIQDGVNHLTLETIFDRPDLWEKDFPVKKYEYQFNTQPETEYDSDGKKVNNEKIYGQYDVFAYTTNTNREFYVEDTVQLERDSSIPLNTTYNFNDLYPIPSLQKDIDNDGTMEELVIKDTDRIEIATQAYRCAVRKLKAQRPERKYQFNTTALSDLTYVGSVSRLMYSKEINQEIEGCDSEVKKSKIINIDELLYITDVTITFDDVLNETATITLDAEVRPHEISATEVELQEAAGTKDDVAVRNLNSTFNVQRYREMLRRGEGGEYMGLTEGGN